MAGLINTTMGGTSKTDELGNDVVNANTTGYDASTRTVDPTKETASGQLNTLLATGSPYLDLARGQAAEQANSRGLLNSSMAAGAGEAAAIGAAVPIATHDADTYTAASRDNQGAVNTANQFTAGEANENSRTNAAAANYFPQLKASTGAQQSLIGTQTEAQSRLQAENAAHAESLTRIQGQIQSGLSSQQAVQQEALQRVQAELQSGLIKTQAEATARQAQLQAELTSKLQSEQAAHEESLTRVQGAIQSGLSQQQAIQQEAQSRVQGEISAGLITTQEQANSRLAAIQGQIQSGLLAQQGSQQSALSTQSAAQAQQLEQVRGQVEQQLQQLRGTQASDLANIEGNYRQLIQGNASATSLYSTVINNMSAVLADTNTSTEQKQAAIDTMSKMLDSGLTIIGGMANVDISGLLNFNP